MWYPLIFHTYQSYFNTKDDDSICDVIYKIEVFFIPFFLAWKLAKGPIYYILYSLKMTIEINQNKHEKQLLT